MIVKTLDAGSQYDSVELAKRPRPCPGSSFVFLGQSTNITLNFSRMQLVGV